MSATFSDSIVQTSASPPAPKSKKSRKKKKPAAPIEADDRSKVDATGHDLEGESTKEIDDDIVGEGVIDQNAEQPRSIEKAREEPGYSSPDDTEMGSRGEFFGQAHIESINGGNNTETQERLDALLQDREALREEVSVLRQSLEDIQSKHEKDMKGFEVQLQAERSEKEGAQEQYESLLGRVNTLRTQLGERLKADAAELEQAHGEIEALRAKSEGLQEQHVGQAKELTKLTAERDEQSRELSSLRNRTTLSQQNWDEERNSLIQREALSREEFENARQAMQDWEVLAMEERNVRQNLEEKLAEVEDQREAQRRELSQAKQDRDTQANAVEGLQKGLQEIQEARRLELRELVEKTELQIVDLRKQLDEAANSEQVASNKLDDSREELSKLRPLESEIKEKNLLIGKLRHEAVILNDHLTKALRQLKRGKTDDVIDRQLVTNHLIQFLSLNQGDPKKFQILQIMAAMLNWSDEQREQAGLSRPGASNPNLRTPISPWHRTPSTPTLNAANLGMHSVELASRKGSIGGLFSEFLESEAEGGSSKATSISGSSRPIS